MKIRNILVPVDFSARSQHARQHAEVFARQFGAKITYLHAIPPSPAEYAAFEGGFYSGGAPAAIEMEPQVRARMREFVAQADHKHTAGCEIVYGDPAHEIERFAQEHDTDLIVMPTHGYGRFRRFLLGSVTTKVLHDAECAVFTGTHVPELAPINQEPYKRIACAVDLTEHSAETLRWALELARACEDDLIIIHAAPEVELGGTYGTWYPAESRKQIEEAARKRVHQLMEEVGVGKAELHVASDHPVDYVRAVADKSYADLLIVGRTPRRGVFGKRLSDAYSLIREAPCPVISV